MFLHLSIMSRNNEADFLIGHIFSIKYKGSHTHTLSAMVVQPFVCGMVGKSDLSTMISALQHHILHLEYS